MAIDPLYTRDELVAKIKALDAQIEALQGTPQQSSFGGNFVSYQARLGELAGLRRQWEDRLKAFDATQGTGGTPSQAAQGPSFKVM